MPAQSFDTIDLYKKVVDEGRLGVRLWVMVRESNERLAQNLATVPDDRLRQPAPDRARDQALMDGALGSRGAWLLEP